MKKLLSILAIILFAFVINTNAQSVSVQGFLGLPMGDFGDGYGIGFGGTATFVYPVSPTFDVTGTAGYQTFGGKDALDGISFNVIPILVGGRISFGQGSVHPYVAAALGLYMGSASGERTFTVGGQTFTVDVDGETQSKFGFRAGGGVLIPMGSVNLDLGTNFNLITTEESSTTYLGFDLGVNIPFN
ncbi:MAG TPA: hypothetical protein VLN45_02140 [Ignavibacteriaceae bacterium]|nr:hypothetical protein [Ignavibacteriaceae bacterium]